MIGNAHIDPMWIWDWHEGMHEVLQTFRSALDRLDEEPKLLFTASSTAYYQWVEQVDPDLFARIREAVASGRWVVTGGEWVEPDCNIPIGESVCRQLLYGQRYLAARLGVTATVGYNIDSFGHAGTLPQLLARSGVTCYVMMRPDENEKCIPSPAFRWQGPDGTMVPAYRIPFDYATRDDPGSDVVGERVGKLLERSEELGAPLMMFFGVGDHGGGPTRLSVKRIHELSEESGGEVGLSDPATYFADLAASSDLGSLPLVEGELQWHSVGCYTSHGEIKRLNARAEQALLSAEKLSVLCHWLTGVDLAVQHEIEEAWKSVLFGQFHDSLGGTCTERAFEGVLPMFGQAIAVADRIATRATHAIVQRVDTWTEGAESGENLESALYGLPVPIVVFNPLSWPVSATIAVPHPIAAVTTDEGDHILTQEIPSGEVTWSETARIFQVPLPSFGYRRCWAHVIEPAATTSSSSSRETLPASLADNGVLENGLLQVSLATEAGEVVSIRDRRNDTETLAGGIRPVVVEDPSDTWSHGIDRYGGQELACEVEMVDLAERGPVRSTYRIAYRFGSSRIEELVSLYKGSPFVELRFDVDWHEGAKLLKISVPFALEDPISTAGAPYGHASRAPAGHEEPMVHWVDLSERGGRFGLTCTADSKYGYDAAGSRLRLTAIRSPRFADSGMGWGSDDSRGYPFMDQGRHRFTYRLHPHTGSLAPETAQRLAAEHLTEFPTVLDTWHHGPLGSSASALSVNDEAIQVPSLKQAENAQGTVVRLWEAGGTGVSGTVQLPFLSRCWQGTLGANELKTLYLPDDPAAPVREIDIPELDLD
jgi:alpha-mannosidase